MGLVLHGVPEQADYIHRLQTVTEVGVTVVFPRGLLYRQVGGTEAEDGRRCSFADFTFCSHSATRQA
jgi:hypothetical protein